MLDVSIGTAKELGPQLESALASYRHGIFIEQLGWDLPVSGHLERDEFDRPDTVYVVSRTPDGRICGCGRLLPTTAPYLLSEVFPHLMGNVPLPRDASVWELSRFSSALVGETMASEEQAINTFELLRAAVIVAEEHGADRLITVSPLGVERLLRRMGVHAHRVAPPALVDGKPVFACWIEIDGKTKRALNC